MKTLHSCLKQLLASAAFFSISPIATNAQTISSAANNVNATTTMSDTAFLKKNITDNLHEIHLSQLGRDKTTDDKIKAAAQQMITDHTQMFNDLTTIAKAKNMSFAGSMGTQGNDMNTGAGVAGMPGTPGSETSNSATNTTTTTTATDEVGGSTTKGGRKGKIRSGNNKMAAPNKVGTPGSGIGAGTSGSKTGTTPDSRPGGVNGNASGMGNMAMHDSQNIPGMEALRNAAGTEFDNLFVAQMLTMHQAKLTELQTASATLTDTQLKTAVNTAIPKIQMHIQVLTQLKGGQ